MADRDYDSEFQQMVGGLMNSQEPEQLATMIAMVSVEFTPDTAEKIGMTSFEGRPQDFARMAMYIQGLKEGAFDDEPE